MQNSKFSPTKTISDLLYTLEHPPKRQPAKKRRPPIDIEEIRKNMKNKWRDPGYCNLQFQKPHILRAKLLTEWQYDRMCLAQRSYKNPKGFKGIKYDQFSREFGDNKGIVSGKFSEYLRKIQENYENTLFSSNLPEKRGGSLTSIQSKTIRIRKMLTENQECARNNLGMFNKTMTKGYFGMNNPGLKKIEKSFRVKEDNKKIAGLRKINKSRLKTLGVPIINRQ